MPQPRRKVLITDYSWESTTIEQEILAQVDAELVIAQRGDEAELAELAKLCAGILTCFAKVTPGVIRAARQLQVIGRYGIGTDNIAVGVATELGIPVTNVPAYCSDEVAEHVIAMIFSLVRGLHHYDRAVREGDWSLARGLPTRRIAGSTLGIVGHGPIGSALEQRARALGMEVLIHRRSGGTPLGELARRSDFVSLHVPLTDRTRGMIDGEFLSAMKPTAYLINAARGAVVDQGALLDALRHGTIAGAGSDVFEPEKLPPDHPLLGEDRLLITPHTAFYSEESVRALQRLAAANVAAVLRGERPAHVVNPEVFG